MGALRMRMLRGTFGAAVFGVNFREELTDENVAAIEAIWLQRHVLLFRGQQIDDAAHARFARRFGSPAMFHVSAGGRGAIPEIYGASNTDQAGRLLPLGDERARLLTMNWFWHMDGSYRELPNKGVVLRAIEVPSGRGDTVFADLGSAYRELPRATKRRINSLACRHSFAQMIARCDMPPVGSHEAATLPTAVHPLVRQRADGRRSLFLSPPYMEAIGGLSGGATQSLVDELTEWATQERFLYRHRWEAGDVLMWDNASTMHKVLPYDLAADKRIMRGATLLGAETVAAPPHD